MKKVLSLVLAICLCASILPAVSFVCASEPEVGATTVYNLVPDKKSGKVWEFTEDKIDQYYSNPNWYFFDMDPFVGYLVEDYQNKNTDGYVFKTGLTAKEVSDSYSRLFSAVSGDNAYFRILTCSTSQSYPYDISDKKPWFALKLDNPGKAGRYSLDLVGTDADTSQRINIWMAPYENGKDDAAYYMTDANQIAKRQLFNNGTARNIAVDFEIADAETPYVFVLQAEGKANDYRINSIVLKECSRFFMRGDSASSTEVNFYSFDSKITAYNEEFSEKSKWYYLDMHEKIESAMEENYKQARILVQSMQIGNAAKGQWLALALCDIPKGLNSVDIEWLARTSSTKNFSIYIAKMVEEADCESYITEENLIQSGIKLSVDNKDDDSTVKRITLDKKVVIEGDSKYAVVFKSDSDESNSFELREIEFTPVAITSVEYNVSKTKLELDETAEGCLIANGTTDVTAMAEFKTSDKNVVTVSENGVITAVGAGVATVTATVNGKAASKEITVTTEPYKLVYNFKSEVFEYNKMPRTDSSSSGIKAIRYTGSDITAETIDPSKTIIMNPDHLAWDFKMNSVTNYVKDGSVESDPYYIMRSTKSTTLESETTPATEPWKAEYASGGAINRRAMSGGLSVQFNYNRYIDETVDDLNHTGKEEINKTVETPRFAIRLYVPNPGEYSLNFSNVAYSSSTMKTGAIANVYFAKAPSAVVTSDTFEGIRDSATKLGTIDNRNPGVTEFENVFEVTEAGDYIVLFDTDATTYNLNPVNPKTKNYTYSNKRYLWSFYLDSITLIPVEKDIVEETISNKVIFAVEANIPDAAIVVSGVDYNGDIDNIARDTAITVEAPEVDGYKFRYWVRGSAENGKWVSSDEEYSFSLLTNTMLTAIYEEILETDDKQIEFWNQNGAYIATKLVVDGIVAAPEATLTGYTFENWYVSEDKMLDATNLMERVTRTVARYAANKISGIVKVDGESQGAVSYNDEITKTVSGAKVWYRDGEPVAYGETYTYYVWGATEITHSTEAPAERVPLIVIEAGNNGAWMIEYDEGDKEIVEAGIVFGNNATIESCKAKATSQKNLSHGQFTAFVSGEDSARGYIIYRDGSEYKVIYSK